VVPAQNSFVFEVSLVGGGTALVYAGDLWSSADDGLKSHDLQYWQQLEFEDRGIDEVSPPTIRPFKWQDEIKLYV